MSPVGLHVLAAALQRSQRLVSPTPKPQLPREPASVPPTCSELAIEGPGLGLTGGRIPVFAGVV